MLPAAPVLHPGEAAEPDVIEMDEVYTFVQKSRTGR